MPHLIFQTKFPMLEQTAEISFFGSIERETMEALQACTFAALQQSNFDGQCPSVNAPVGFWRPSPYSPHVVHFVINLPGSWECRHTIQNILRIAWMDVFEHAGWTILSMWNSNNSAAESSSQGQGNANVSDDPAAASNSDAPSGGSGSGSAAATDSQGSHQQDLSDFKGECANFLLFKRSGSGFQQVGVPAMTWPPASPAPSLVPNIAASSLVISGDEGGAGIKRSAVNSADEGTEDGQPPSKK